MSWPRVVTVDKRAPLSLLCVRLRRRVAHHDNIVHLVNFWDCTVGCQSICGVEQAEARSVTAGGDGRIPATSPGSSLGANEPVKVSTTMSIEDRIKAALSVANVVRGGAGFETRDGLEWLALFFFCISSLYDLPLHSCVCREAAHGRAVAPSCPRAMNAT